MLKNKLLILLPAAMILSLFLPQAITPLLMLGGAYLCYEGVEKVYEFSERLVEVTGALDKATAATPELGAADVDTGGADLSAATQWQIYRQHADAAMQTPVEQKIEYASELKLAIDDAATYGQALAAAQLAAVEAGQQYATVRLQQQLVA